MSASLNKSKSSVTTPSKRSVRELLEELRNPISIPKFKTEKPELDINVIKGELKKNWRDPGYLSSEFSKPTIIRGKILNEWEQERIHLAERSYKIPRGYKGIKFDSHSRKFGETTNNVHSEKFDEYLNKIKINYEQKLFTPDNTIADKGERIKRMLTDNAIKSATTKDFHRTGFFGYSLGKKTKTFSNA